MTNINEPKYLSIFLTVVGARNLIKRDFFKLPDPYVRVSIKGFNQSIVEYSQPCQNTIDPQWKQSFDLCLDVRNTISLSVWDDKKTNKKSAFLGAFNICPLVFEQLKDVGCQKFQLNKRSGIDSTIRGYITVSITTGNPPLTSCLTPSSLSSFSSPSMTSYSACPSRSLSHDSTRTSKSSQNVNRVEKLRKQPSDKGYVKKSNSVNYDACNNQHSSKRLDKNQHKKSERSFQNGNSYYEKNVRNTPKYAASKPSNNGKTPEVLNEAKRQLSYMNRGCLHQAVSDLPEGYEQRTTPQGQVYYQHLPSGISSWYDPRVPSHLLNIEDNGILGDFPSGWEARKTTTGRQYFVNHNLKTTQFTDPRLTSNLPAIQQRIQDLRLQNSDNHLTTTQSSRINNIENATSNKTSGVNTTNDNDTIVISSPNRSPHITEPPICTSTPKPPTTTIMPVENGASTTTLTPNPHQHESNNNNNESNNLIVTESFQIAFNNTPNTNDDTTSSNHHNNDAPMRQSPMRSYYNNYIEDRGARSSAEVALPKFQRDLIQKLRSFRQELKPLQPQGYCRLEVSRDGIFEDSYRAIMKMKCKELRKRLMIKFKGEEGIDYGGVAREWLYHLSHEMLNPYYGLFQYCRDDIYTLQINPDSSINPDHLSYFHFVGRVIGMAIFHNHYIDGGFTLPFYKQLLGKPFNLKDLEGADPDLYRSLLWILDNDITGVLEQMFMVEHHAFGQVTHHELKEGGANIPVTEENKREYVFLYVTWRFKVGVEKQFVSLKKGLLEVVPTSMLKRFDEKEIELVICGLGKIDIADWRKNTRLKNCTGASDVVKWFWRAVEAFDEEKRARLLQFTTGSSKVPFQGFQALQGSTCSQAPRPFTIHQVDTSTDKLPQAHTCFNRIDIPPYETYDKFHDKLTCAIEETCGFTVE